MSLKKKKKNHFSVYVCACVCGCVHACVSVYVNIIKAKLVHFFPCSKIVKFPDDLCTGICAICPPA